MIYKYSSPTPKTTITSPRKVTLHKSPQPYQHQTKITSTKKIIIQTKFDPLISHSNQPSPHLTTSSSPENQPLKINKANSQLKHSNNKIVINQISNKQVANKENDFDFTQNNQLNSNIYQLSSTVKKFSIPNLFTSKQDIYQGPHNQKGHFHGQGTYFFKACNIVYEGQFNDGQINGFGKLCFENPVNHQFPIVYEGDFRHVKKHGTGTYFYSDKNHFYRGEWVNDMKEGNGYYESPFQIYEGFWAKNKKHGQGFLINKKNNTEFKGKFYDDYFIEGEIRYSNGDVYVGSFHLGKKEGYGTYFYKGRNEEYQGQFSNDLRHGKGTLKMSNGDQFTGCFRHGRIDESMNCQYKWENGNVFNGWFKNSQPDKGTIKSISEEIEYEYTSTASYIQY